MTVGRVFPGKPGEQVGKNLFPSAAEPFPRPCFPILERSTDLRRASASVVFILSKTIPNAIKMWQLRQKIAVVVKTSLFF
jgi:hypothetical protein